MILDCKRAVTLFIQHRDIISPSEVVTQLLGASKKCDNRYFLHLYLHSLFEIDLNAGKEFHDLQVRILFYFIFQSLSWISYITIQVFSVHNVKTCPGSSFLETSIVCAP